MEYKKGDRVKHPTMQHWGIGEVLADSMGDIVKIFFVGAGEKRISLKYVMPEKIMGEEAVHPVLEQQALFVNLFIHFTNPCDDFVTPLILKEIFEPCNYLLNPLRISSLSSGIEILFSDLKIFFGGVK